MSACNPYVGPRPFDRGEQLYGRDREADELRDLLVAERIVLLYSPSGAGKTSLIRARLVPELEEAGFKVLPEIRVAAGLPPTGGALPAFNRYLMSTLLCLEKGVQRDLGELAGMSLDTYLTQRGGEDGREDVLIFDQFEEFLVADLADRDPKTAFLKEVGAALRNHERRRWALFSIREDFVAGLDPYLRLLPTRLRTTFRLDLLGVPEARAAIQEPAREAGVDFSDEAVQVLVDSLRRVRVRRPEGTQDVPGPYVEPVQLQVVCRQLWEKRAGAGASRITQSDIERAGDVDRALADYYDERVKAVVAKTRADERAIRTWFDQALITEQGIRAQTLAGPLHGGAEEERILGLLEDARLIRMDTRGGVRWLELAHDRLIDPVRTSNEANLHPVQRQARLWQGESRPDHLLLTGAGLAEADRWAAEQSGPLDPLERDFLAAGKKRRRARRLAVLITSAALVFALVVLAGAIYRVQLALSNARASESAVLLGVDPAAAVERAVDATVWPSTAAAREALTQSFAEFHLRAVLRNRGDSVGALDASPDGRLVVTTSADGKARTWDMATGEPMAPPFGERVRSAEFSPDGSRIVTANLDGTARVWDAHGRQQAVLEAHEAAVSSARWSPVDGARIVTASLDDTARVWDARGVPGPVLSAGTGDGVLSAAWSPDESLIVTASADRTIQVWDASTGQRLGEAIPLDSRVIQPAEFSPDGSRVVTAAGGMTFLFDWRTGENLGPLPGDQPEFSEDGDYLLAVGERIVTVWPAGGGDRVSVLDHAGEVTVARFDEGGTRVVTGSRDGVTRVWDVATGARLLELRGHRGAVNAAMFAPAQPEVVVTAGVDGTARVWDATVGPLFTGYPEWLNSASFSADGRLVVGAGADGVARVWPAGGGAQVAELAEPRLDQAPRPPLSSAAFSRDGRYVVTGDDDGTVHVWDRGAGNRPVASVTIAPDGVNAVAFDPEGKRVVIAGAGNVVRIWEWEADQPPRRLGEHDGPVTDAVFSPDGTRVLTASEDGTARVWDAASGALLQMLTGHVARVSSAAFDPLGELVVTTSADRTARVWEVATGQVAVLVGHESDLTDAAFSSDGRYVATGASDGTVGIWEARTGRNLALLAIHSRAVLSVRFSPAGPLILTASLDRTARVYDCEICVPVQEVHELAVERLRYVSDRLPAVRP